MIYQIPLNKLTTQKDSFEVVCVLDFVAFIKSKKALKSPFKKAELPAEFIEAEALKLAKAKEAKCAELNAVCDSHLMSFESSALGETHIYDSALEDQLNLLGLVSAGIDSYFRCLKKGASVKENKPHSKAQLAAVYKDGLTYKSEQIYKCGLLKAKVMAAKTLDEVASVAWEEEQKAQGELPNIDINSLTPEQRAENERLIAELNLKQNES